MLLRYSIKLFMITLFKRVTEDALNLGASQALTGGIQASTFFTDDKINKIATWTQKRQGTSIARKLMQSEDLNSMKPFLTAVSPNKPRTLVTLGIVNLSLDTVDGTSYKDEVQFMVCVSNEKLNNNSDPLKKKFKETLPELTKVLQNNEPSCKGLKLVVHGTNITQENIATTAQKPSSPTETKETSNDVTTCLVVVKYMSTKFKETSCPMSKTQRVKNVLRGAGRRVGKLVLTTFRVPKLSPAILMQLAVLKTVLRLAKFIEDFRKTHLRPRADSDHFQQWINSVIVQANRIPIQSWEIMLIIQKPSAECLEQEGIQTLPTSCDKKDTERYRHAEGVREKLGNITRNIKQLKRLSIKGAKNEDLETMELAKQPYETVLGNWATYACLTKELRENERIVKYLEKKLDQRSGAEAMAIDNAIMWGLPLNKELKQKYEEARQSIGEALDKYFDTNSKEGIVELEETAY